MSNQSHFDRLGVPLSERPGHTSDCPHFERLYPWECDCQEVASAKPIWFAEGPFDALALLANGRPVFIGVDFARPDAADLPGDARK